MAVSGPHFLRFVGDRGADTAIIDGRAGKRLSYKQLSEHIRRGADALSSSGKKLALLLARNDIGSVLCYLSLLSAGHAVQVASAGISPSAVLNLIEHYTPELVAHPKDQPLPAGSERFYNRGVIISDYAVAIHGDNSNAGGIHPELALLLSTSGSTGSPKYVRLSYGNISSNAQQISSALDMCPNDRVVLSLPLQFSYGISLLHSSLEAGASLVIPGYSLVQPMFWKVCRIESVTMLPAVPAILGLMRSLGFDRFHLPALQKLTISGGPMDDTVRAWLLSRVISEQQRNVYSMYGLTEATARVSVLPSQLFRELPTSVGRPVQGGNIQISESSEIVYRGPNVMLGYASRRDDLGRQDELAGVLSTGDLGSLDADGNLYLFGRLSRFCKILGARIDLSDVERSFAEYGEVAAVSDDICITVYHTETGALERSIRDRAGELADRLRVPRHLIVAQGVSELPRTVSGKIRYPDLRSYGQRGN